MTDDELDRHIRAIIAREGGWVDDPDDSGGPTNYGITLETWQAYCRATPGMEGRGTKEELRSLTAQDPWLWTCYRWYFRTQGLPELVSEFGLLPVQVPLMMDMRTLHSPYGCRRIWLRAVRWQETVPPWQAYVALSRMMYMLEVAQERRKDKKHVEGWMRRALKAIGMWPPEEAVEI